VSRKTKRFKEDLAYEFDYDYVADKALSLFVVLSIVAIIVVVPNWPYLVLTYGSQLASYGLSAVGYTLLYTTLIAFLIVVGAIAPHFTESIRPKGFKRITEERRLEINFYVMVSLLAVASLTALAVSSQYLPP